MRAEWNKAAERTAIPWMMGAGRAIAGPVLILGARSGWNGFAMAGLVLMALLSDVFDGVLARRWKSDTAGLRLFDSIADSLFYVCAAAALWQAVPQFLSRNAPLLSAVLGLELLRLAFDLAKFGRPASYHSYLAKTWGLVLAPAVMLSLTLGRSTGLMTAALWLGVACQLEGLAMSAVLPTWRRDVLSLRMAWRLRNSAGVVVREAGVRSASCVGLALVVIVLTGTACAVEPGHVVYQGGTLRDVTVGSEGGLDVSSASAMVLRFGSREVAIPYTRILSYRYAREATHHLGVLPAIAVGLLAARQHRDTFFIDYADDTGATQVVAIDTASNEHASINELLRVRVAVNPAR